MRKLVFLCLILLSSDIHSQEFIKISDTKKDIPTVIFNSEIIGSLKIIDSIELKAVKDVTILKNKHQSDEHITHFDNLSEYGIILINIDIDIKSKEQSELNVFFGLKAGNPIYIDGYLIQNPNYKIATEAIIEIEKILPNTANSLKTEILSIWTLDKEDRKGSSTKCGGIIIKN